MQQAGVVVSMMFRFGCLVLLLASCASDSIEIGTDDSDVADVEPEADESDVPDEIDPCDPHGDWDGEICECDAGYVVTSDCESCEGDDDSDECPETSFAWDGECYCGQGTTPNDAGCGCEASGSLGAPCSDASDCLGGLECLHHFEDLCSDGDLEIPFPGGYCGPWIMYAEDRDLCESDGGVYLDDDPIHGEAFNACLYTCVTDAQCRDGYACRTLESYDMNEGLDLPEGITYCLAG